MVEFITTNWISILVVLIFIGVIAILMTKGKKEIAYKMLYTLVTEAEKQHGSGSGSLKFAEVITKAYSILPPVIKFFITYDTLASWVEDALEDAKDFWATEAGIKELDTK